MPLHNFVCANGHLSELYQPLDGLKEWEQCPSCDEWAQKRFLRAPAGRVLNVQYQSPVDGRAITTKHAREEDLARNNCVPYDPEMKTDYLRRQRESNEAIEKKADALVEAEIHNMGARKRERLEAEFRNGADLAFERSTTEG